LKFVDCVAQRLRTMPPRGTKMVNIFRNWQLWAPLPHGPNIPAPPNFQVY